LAIALQEACRKTGESFFLKKNRELHRRKKSNLSRTKKCRIKTKAPVIIEEIQFQKTA
jgi:hypothetical protein